MTRSEQYARMRDEIETIRDEAEAMGLAGQEIARVLEIARQRAADAVEKAKQNEKGNPR